MIVDDHAVVREGLKRIIEDKAGLLVTAEAGDSAQAIRHLQCMAVDVLVLDLDLPGRGGLDLLCEIKRGWPDMPVLVLSFHAETAYGVPSLRAGADGYLMKDSSTGLLVQAIEKVAAGGKFVTPSLAEQLVRSVGPSLDQARHEALSERELAVLKLIGSGHTVSGVADQMSLSVKTVSTYRRRLLDKMGLLNNAQLTHYAIKHDLAH
jgi:DNA-binding NarL/FixJ family response regulator